MNEKYHNNKDPYIQFLKNWLTQIMDENKTIFVDDYHIDEIVPSIPRKIWFNLGFKIYQEYRYFLENTCPQMDVMLCIDMGESKTKFSIPTFLDDHIIGNSDVPPSIYLFNKQNTNIIDTLKVCILLPNLITDDTINVFYKEEYDDNFFATIFISDIIIK